jgi:SAM-dependent methyltransferase
MTAERVDFGRAAEDYARHRAGFPDELFTRLATLGVGSAGQRVLDVGTGTGTLARGFARRGCRVTGLDVPAPLVEQARLLDGEAGVSVEYAIAPAERAGFADGSFDLISAGQCWHWFDRARMAREARRMLTPTGALLIAYLDWVSLPGSVADVTESLIERTNPKWTFRGWSSSNLKWADDAAVAGFEDRQCFAFDLTLRYTHEAWRGRIRASAGIGASLPEDAVARFDDEHRRLLVERFPDEPLAVPHRVFALVARVGR